MMPMIRFTITIALAGILGMAAAAAQPQTDVVGDQELQFFSVFASEIPAVRVGQVLIQKHLYLACVETAAKQPAWVAFRVSRADWETENVLERNFTTPAELRDICLEQSDYADSGFDLGHLYGLQFVSASRYAHEVNQLCAIGAQRPALNRGPWRKGENRIRERSLNGTISVLTGQLWLDSQPELPRADEPHRIGSHFWMILGTRGSAAEEAYLFPQDVQIDDRLESFRTDAAELRNTINTRWWGGVR